VRVLFFYRGTEHFGIEYLSAVLTQAGHVTELIYDPGLDNNFHWQWDALRRLNVPSRLMKRARDFAPDLIAFSSITNLYPYVKEMARMLKAELKVPTVIGGIHATVLAESVLKEDCFDIVCRGEGEYALVDLANKLERQEDITSIPNLWVKDEHGVIHRNEPRPLIQDLDSLPFADKDIFYRSGAFWRNVQILTGRGCPYRCTYCVNSYHYRMNVHREKLVRRRSVGNVIEELRINKKKFKPTMIIFADDTFTFSADWLEEFADIYKTEIGVPFQCNIHPLTVKPRTVNALKKAGCGFVSMGIQTANSELRKRLLARNETNERIMDACRLIQDAGIGLETELIFGLPEETPEIIWESVEMNRKIRPHATSTFVFYPFPGTDLADYCLEHGFIDPEGFKNANEGIGSYLSTLLLRHKYSDLVLNVVDLLPLFVKLPDSLSDGLLRRMCARKHGPLAQALGFIGVPLSDPWLAKARTLDYFHMVWRLYKPLPVQRELPVPAADGVCALPLLRSERP